MNEVAKDVEALAAEINALETEHVHLQQTYEDIRGDITDIRMKISGKRRKLFNLLKSHKLIDEEAAVFITDNGYKVVLREPGISYVESLT